MTFKGKNWRNNLIRKIKTLQNKVIGMTDDEYYTMLMDRYDKDSSTKLTFDELMNLSAHLEKIAGQDQDKKALPDAQARKIWKLWQELHEAGAVRDKSEKALNAFVKRQTKVESYRWLNRYQASDVIEALKKWLKRTRAA
jgi:phage gp16-like protein